KALRSDFERPHVRVDATRHEELGLDSAGELEARARPAEVEAVEHVAESERGIRRRRHLEVREMDRNVVADARERRAARTPFYRGHDERLPKAEHESVVSPGEVIAELEIGPITGPRIPVEAGEVVVIEPEQGGLHVDGSFRRVVRERLTRGGERNHPCD